MYKSLKYLLFFLILTSCSNKQFNSLSKEQKMYEFSTIWKEVSYNFANFDNCPQVNFDSLYLDYLPKIIDSKNDFEYAKLIQKFMATLDNGHTNLEDLPNYLYPYLGWFKIKTTLKNNKVYIDNYGKKYENKLAINDEIIAINDIPVMEYLEKFIMPYIATTHPSKKLELSMMYTNSYYLTWRDSKMKLSILRNGKSIDVQLKVTSFLLPTKKEQEEEVDNEWIVPISYPQNEFYTDSSKGFAYIKLNACDRKNLNYFLDNKNVIKKCENLIIDLTDNGGGYSNFCNPIIDFLVDQDTLSLYPIKVRTNNSLYKAYGERMDTTHRDSWSKEQFNSYYYNFYLDKSFETIRHQDYWLNSLPQTERCTGNIYVIIGENTASAAEFLVTMLSQNKNILFIGETTAGAVGQPLRVFLKSGVVVKMNTIKSYDFENKDISYGFEPDYVFDYYKYNNEKDSLKLFQNLVNFIKFNNL